MSMKRKRSGTFDDIESVLLEWFNQMRESGGAVSSQMIMEKSKQFAIQMNEDFNPAAGLLYRWQKREGIKIRNIQGEAASANTESADAYITQILPELFSSHDASEKFNADESGLFIKALLTKTLNKKGSQVKGHELKCV